MSGRCQEAASRPLRPPEPISLIIFCWQQSGDLTFILPAPRLSGPAMGVRVGVDRDLDWTGVVSSSIRVMSLIFGVILGLLCQYHGLVETLYFGILKISS